MVARTRNIGHPRDRLTYRIMKEVRNHYRLYLMLALPLVYLILFCYVPMGSLIIAFEDYSVRQGIFKSQWIGLLQFDKIFSTPTFAQLLRNVKTVYADYWPHTDNGEYIGWSGLTMLEMTNGVRASLEESFANGSTLDGWSNEYLRAECTDGTIIASHKKVTLRSDCSLPYPQEAEMPLAKGDYWDHALIIRSFIRWLDGGDAPVTCIDDNMQCAALMFAAIESAKTGKKIDVQEYLRKYL